MNRTLTLLFVFLSLLPAQSPPVTGDAVPGMAAYDRLVPAFLAKYRIPGASVAVMRDGRLVFARGYGFADVDARAAVQPDSLFRVASISKPITAAAVLKLAEEGKLNLDARVLDVLNDVRPAAGQNISFDFRNVTIRHLLWHAGGWDSARSGDAMFQNAQVTAALGVPSPAGCNDVIRWMLSRPLDFTPGQRYAYSNFGYCLLGRVIEKTSGQPYETFVQENVLLPAGIGRMSIGSSLRAGRKPEEVVYYPYAGEPNAASVFPEGPREVPPMYGAWDLRAMDAHGGWVGSAIDLLRFVKALDNQAILNRASLTQMLAKPPTPIAAANATTHYGMGFMIRPGAPNGGNWWHNGSLPGTATLLVRAGQNRSAWAILLNSRDRAPATLFSELDQMMWSAINQSTVPDHDLFPRYASVPDLVASVSQVEFDPPYSPKTITLRSPAGARDFSVTVPNANWLRASANSIQTPATITLTIMPAGLEEGTYKETVQIATTGANRTVLPVEVTLRVNGVPVITAIRNAASKLDGPVAPVSLAEITGANLDGASLLVNGMTLALEDGRFVVPAELAAGELARFTAALPDGRSGAREVEIQSTAPGLFSGSLAEGVLTLTGTGFRNQTDLAAFAVQIGSDAGEILAVKPHPDRPGIDLVEVRWPENVTGETVVTLTVDGKASNEIRVNSET